MPRCEICGEKLHFVVGKGWVHPDGSSIKQKSDPKRPGKFLEDHYALPEYESKKKKRR